MTQQDALQQAWQDAADAVTTAATVARHPDADAVDASTRDAVQDAAAALGSVQGSHPRNAGGALVTLHCGALVDAYADAVDAATRSTLASNALASNGGNVDAAGRALALVLGYVASTRSTGSNGLWGAVADALGAGGPGAGRSAYARTVQGVDATQAVRTGPHASSASAWATAHGKRWAAVDALRGRQDALCAVQADA